MGRRWGCCCECCLALSFDLLCRLSSTKRKEPRASEDQVLSDPKTKVEVQMKGEETSGSLSPCCTFTLCPVFADHGKGFSIQNTQDTGPFSTKPYTNGAASTNQVRGFLCMELPWPNRCRLRSPECGFISSQGAQSSLEESIWSGHGLCLEPFVCLRQHSWHVLETEIQTRP